jgi:hypothetical protein
LIVASVLIVTHGFWLEDRLSREHVDLLSFWLPRWCAMGKAVFSGHIPTWLPNQFGGVPFASDPQSGWAYIPVMLFFGLTSCSRALGWMITLNPLLAGLGMYWFFRGDRLSRPAATMGGLVMGLTIAGSVVALSMPFAGALGWLAVALAGLSHMLHAKRPSSIVGWLALTALAWSQIAAAHLTHGLLTGTAIMAVYALARLTVQVRSGERSFRSAAIVAAVPVVAVPLLSAAVVYPRLKLLPRTSIGQGYLQLGLLTKQLGGFRKDTAYELSPLFNRGIHVWWGTGFARGPGTYVGAATILLIAFGIWSRRWRLPALAFAILGFIGFALNMDRLIRSGLHTLLLHTEVGELWLRDPYRFRYMLLPTFAAMGAYGFQAWLDAWSADGEGIRRRTVWLLMGGSVVLFVIAPMIGGASIGSYIPFLVAVLPTAWLLWQVTKRTSWAAAALPVLLAVELSVTALAGQTGPPLNGLRELSQNTGKNPSGAGPSFGDYHTAWIPPASYDTPGAIGRVLIRAHGDGGRYLTYDHKIALSNKGFLFHQAPYNWPAYASGRSVLFGINEIQGYSPVQLLRYWTFLRALDVEKPIYYNSATFQSEGTNVRDLFALEWIIQRSSNPPPEGATAVTTEGNWTLYRITDPAPRAELVPYWNVVSPAEALQFVLAPASDQRNTVVLERVPAANGRPVPAHVAETGIVGGQGTASYQDVTDEHAQVHVTTSTGGVVLIRNPWDENWNATVDGKSVPLLHADYVMQGVAVPEGTHTIDLYYRDTAIGTGLWISAIAWLLLLIAFVVLRRRESRGELSRAEGSSLLRSEPPHDTEPAPAG